MRARRPWFTTAAVIALVLWSVHQQTGWGLAVGALYLLWCGFLAGKSFWPSLPRRWQLYFGTLAHLALLTVAGALTYWGYRLNELALDLLLAVTPLVWLRPRPAGARRGEKIWSPDPRRGLPRQLGTTTILVGAFLLLEYFSLLLLFQAATTEAIRTPWQVVSPQFFLTYLLATVALVALTMRTDHAGRRLPLVVLHLTLTVSVAAIVYQLGYGFDSFIHQATEHAIASSGQVLPKTPWYLGQYALVIILAKIFALPTALVDRMAALVGFGLLAFFAYVPWRQQALAAVAPLGLLALPLAPFIVTTPQALANGWLLLTSLTSTLPFLMAETKRDLRWLGFGILTASAALLTHPIAGVPAVTLVALTALNRSAPAPQPAQGWPKTLGMIVVVGLAAISLPLLFRWSPAAGPGTVSLAAARENLWALVTPNIPRLANRFHPALDLAYAIESSRLVILVAVAWLGSWHLIRRRLGTMAKPAWLTAVACLGSAILLPLVVPFSNLVDSEQGLYPARVLELAQYALLPLALVGGMAILRRLDRDWSLRLSLIILVPTVATALVYLAYPRADRYRFDHGFNLTAADITAVRHVAADARGDYLVLANQMTSAAAVREFGFFRYYPAADGSGQHYFAYPIPTGQPLYQHYLAMVYQSPSRETAQRAAGLVAAEIRSVYFILNRYWDNFDAIASTAQKNADRWWAVDGGRALIFRYDLRQ